MPRKHGDPIPTPSLDRLPDSWQGDPDMWSGLSMDMGTYLAWERAMEGDGDD